VHDSLEKALSDNTVLLDVNDEGKRTFFDTDLKEE
jgi:hypothetical protein